MEKSVLKKSIFYCGLLIMLSLTEVYAIGLGIDTCKHLKGNTFVLIGIIFLIIGDGVAIYLALKDARTELDWLDVFSNDVIDYFKNHSKQVNQIIRFSMFLSGIYLVLSGALLWLTSKGIWPVCPHGVGSTACAPKITTVWMVFPLASLQVDMFLWSFLFGGYEMIGSASVALATIGLTVVLQAIDKNNPFGFWSRVVIVTITTTLVQAFFLAKVHIFLGSILAILLAGISLKVLYEREFRQNKKKEG